MGGIVAGEINILVINKFLVYVAERRRYLHSTPNAECKAMALVRTVVLNVFRLEGR